MRSRNKKTAVPEEKEEQGGKITTKKWKSQKKRNQNRGW
jgi:hypothetical protein